MSTVSSATSQTVRTMCPMSCHPTLCGMLAEVEGDRLVGVRGDPANPDSKGFLCIRGQATPEIFGNPARLLQPLLRDQRGGALRPASWDEAMTRIAQAIAAEPAHATAFWPGHGTFTSNYGTRIAAQLMWRFAHLHGSQFFSPTMICWGLGAFGLGLTGVLETHTPQDMAAHSQLIVLWGANFASQPTTAPYLLQARARGAQLVAIDVRQTEATAKADEVLLIRPGTDTALALALMHVICAEGLQDDAFIAAHTSGFGPLQQHVRAFTPQWASTVTGLRAEQIVALARRYASTRPAMLLLGGSSMHKGDNGWEAARAIACLPALAGQLGVPGGGIGPRHGGSPHGRALRSIVPPRRAPHGPVLPNQMAAITEALHDGRIANLLLMGTNMLSSFADANAVAAGLARTRLVVAYDLFLSATAQRCADVVLPATAWLEELGCKVSSTHVYLMEQALQPAGEVRSVSAVMRELAQRLDVADFFPWADDAAVLDAVLDHPSTGHATVASLRARGGMAPLAISPVAHPTHVYDTPSGKVEFVSQRAAALGLPALPSCAPPTHDAHHPLVLTQGRTLNHFHSFYNNGSVLPTLARRERTPQLWIAPADASSRGISDGASIRVFNARGTLAAQAHVTERVPPGVLWLRDGWPGLNQLTDGARVLPDHAVDAFAFAAGQARFEARVDVSLADSETAAAQTHA